MKKIALFFLFIVYITCTGLSDTIDTLSTEPYHHFDWLDEDDYTISIAYQSGATVLTTCCLWNGTHFCKGDCSGSGPVSCKFTGASCGADPDNAATKFYYALYCDNTACASSDAASGLTSSMSVDVTVAVSKGNYISYSILLFLTLLAL